MIYLFCNRTYGAPFLEAATRYARRTGTPITAVYSPATRSPATKSAADWVRRVISGTMGGRIAVTVVDDVNSDSFLKRIEPIDAGVVAGFNQIFGQAAIGRFGSLVNFHASLLPYYRGPTPAHWCLENGESKTGFTLHAVTTKIDAGEILYQGVVPIVPGDDAPTLSCRIAEAGAPVLERWIDHLRSGEAWTPVRVDAASEYRVLVDYKSFPDRPRS